MSFDNLSKQSQDSICESEDSSCRCNAATPHDSSDNTVTPHDSMVHSKLAYVEVTRCTCSWEVEHWMRSFLKIADKSVPGPGKKTQHKNKDNTAIQEITLAYLEQHLRLAKSGLAKTLVRLDWPKGNVSSISSSSSKRTSLISTSLPPSPLFRVIA